MSKVLNVDQNRDPLEEFFLATGQKIVVSEKVRKHLEAHPGIEDILPAAAQNIIISLKQTYIAAEVDMGYVVGSSGAMTTEDNSGTLEDAKLLAFAKRSGRNIWSRVEKVLPEYNDESQYVTIIAKATGADYALVTAYVGRMIGKEPTDPSLPHFEDIHEAIEAWGNSALIYDKDTMSDIKYLTWAEAIDNEI